VCIIAARLLTTFGERRRSLETERPPH